MGNDALVAVRVAIVVCMCLTITRGEAAEILQSPNEDGTCPRDDAFKAPHYNNFRITPAKQLSLIFRCMAGADVTNYKLVSKKLTDADVDNGGFKVQ